MESVLRKEKESIVRMICEKNRFLDGSKRQSEL